MTTDKLRTAHEKKAHGVCCQLWVLIFILSLLPVLSCGRYRAEHERKRNECFAEILKRVDRNWIGEDRFFEDNLLANPYPEVRQWCALALARIGSARALPLLFRAAQTGDAAVRASSAFAIGAIQDRELLGNQYPSRDTKPAWVLIDLLDDSSISVQMRAVEALGKIGSHHEAIEIMHRLEGFAYHGSPAERSFLGYAITALARLKDPAAFHVLEMLAGSSDSEVRRRALDALASLKDEKASPLFIDNLESSDPGVLSSAIVGISNLGPAAAGHVLRFLPPRDSRTGAPIPLIVRCSAVRTLGKLKNAAAIPSIQAALDADPVDVAHPDQLNFAILAAGALGEIGSKEAEPVLIPMLRFAQPAANSAAIALAQVLRGDPGRFFAHVHKSRFNTPAALPAWSRAMAELGSTDAYQELNRMIAQALENPGGSQSRLLPIFLDSLVKANPPRLQETLITFLKLRDPEVLPTAVAAYRPDPNVKEPWVPIVEAFAGCCPGAKNGPRAGILLSLAPWTGDSRVQQVLWSGLKDPDRGVRLAALALLRKSGISGALEDPGPSAGSLTGPTSIALASSRKNSTIAVVKTNRGTFEVELFREDAPLTVADFTQMARRGTFEGYVFEEVNPSQLVGAGDFEPSGSVRSTNHEINMRPFERGSVGTAPGSGGGRFFLALAPQPHFEGVNTCFGRIISGIQVADRITPGDRILHIDIKETISFLDYVRY